MKSTVFTVFILLISISGFSQNILGALRLLEDSLGKYEEEELRATDTIIDLNNAYYEEFMDSGGGAKTVLRQATLFHNYDESRLLGVTISTWNFVCFDHKTTFFEIAKRKKQIKKVDLESLLPQLSIQELVPDTVYNILQAYLPKIQSDYLGPDATIEQVLSEIYTLKCVLPREGTNLKIKLAVCDYIPTNEVNISAEDWSHILNSTQVLELKYDKKEKRFLLN